LVLLAVLLAPEVRDPVTLLARFKIAAGGAAWDSVTTVRSSGSLTIGGTAGTYELVEDLGNGRLRQRFALGVARGEQGFDGVRPWELTAAGKVVVKTSIPDLEAARTEAYRTARAYWYPQRWAAQRRYDRRDSLDGRPCHVLVIRPRGGREFELWLDAQTHLAVRTVERGTVDVITTSYSDWRPAGPAGKVKAPHRVVSASGHGEAVTVVQSVAIETIVEPAATFTPPGRQPDDFAIGGGSTATTVPIERIDNHVYVRARIDGGPPRRFLVDSGGANLLTPDAAAALGLEPEGELEVAGVGDGGERAGFVRPRSLALGDLTWQSPLFLVVPLDGVAEANGVEFDGLLGHELFERLVVTIDYAAGRLTLTHPVARGTAPAPPPAIELPLRFDGTRPVVAGSLDGIAATFMVDTGNRGALTVHRPFAERHRLARRFAAGPETVIGWGVGGPARGRRAGTRSLSLGRWRMDGVATDLSTQEKGAMASRAVSANLGGGLLKRFTVTFDYGRRLLVLLPGSLPPDPPDRSGLWINREKAGAAFRIEAVAAGSPAAAAGLRVGDRVLAVDGRSAPELTLAQARDLLRRSAGTEVRLRLEGAGGSAAEVVFRLGDPR
jgi:hypothetical protein